MARSAASNCWAVSTRRLRLPPRKTSSTNSQVLALRLIGCGSGRGARARIDSLNYFCDRLDPGRSSGTARFRPRRSPPVCIGRKSVRGQARALVVRHVAAAQHKLLSEKVFSFSSACFRGGRSTISERQAVVDQSHFSESLCRWLPESRRSPCELGRWLPSPPWR